MKSPTCTFAGCNVKTYAKELCLAHYRQQPAIKSNRNKWRSQDRKMNGWSVPCLYSLLKSRAKQKGLDENILTLEEFTVLRSKTCAYGNHALPTKGYGLDRKDSTRGYSIDNVVPCCSECNYIKNNDLSYAEMKEMMTERNSPGSRRAFSILTGGLYSGVA